MRFQVQKNPFGIPSLKLTASLPLKMNGGKMKSPFGARPILRGQMVSFRECSLSRCKMLVLPEWSKIRLLELFLGIILPSYRGIIK